VIFKEYAARVDSQSSYGFQTPTKIRMVLSVALVDAMIKDADIVAVSGYPVLNTTWGDQSPGSIIDLIDELNNRSSEQSNNS
jgi:hypothetical protein